MRSWLLILIVLLIPNAANARFGELPHSDYVSRIERIEDASGQQSQTTSGDTGWYRALAEVLAASEGDRPLGRRADARGVVHRRLRQRCRTLARIAL